MGILMKQEEHMSAFLMGNFNFPGVKLHEGFILSDLTHSKHALSGITAPPYQYSVHMIYYT